jgi:Flp pilus assembly pilin Flp
MTALREQRTPPPPPSIGETDEHNPFAPPPKDSPERPWQPRLPAGEPARQQQQQEQQQPPAGGPGGGGAPGGSGSSGSSGGGTGPRFDVTDPAQRRARYALLAGMWGLFFGLFSLPEVALLLGALALYWGISSLRAKPGDGSGQGEATGAGRADVLAAMRSGPPRDAGPAATGQAAPAAVASPPYARDQRNPQFTAAMSGVIAGLVALAIVAVTFTFQLVYRDYYSCVNDALTQPARESCNHLLPKQLRPVLGVQG